MSVMKFWKKRQLAHLQANLAGIQGQSRALTELINAVTGTVPSAMVELRLEHAYEINYLNKQIEQLQQEISQT